MDVITRFLTGHVGQIVWIVIIFVVGRRALRIIVRRVITTTCHTVDCTPEERDSFIQRGNTLQGILIATGDVVLYAILFFLVLGLFSIDLRPFLTGAGILGLAIGFGTQTLVKDFVSGLFILFEDQYSIGERVKINATEGVVEKITMRSTVIRDDEGALHFIGNGVISKGVLVNFSRAKK